MISPRDLERLNRMDAEREARWRVIEEIGARNADKDPEEIEHDVAEAIAEARAEQRAQQEVTPKA